MRTALLLAGLSSFLLAGSSDVAAQSMPREIVVVGSKVKEVIREAGLRSDGELVQAVSDEVRVLIEAAVLRAKSNRRSHVRPHDLEEAVCNARDREIVVVGSKVKDVVREAGLRVSSDFVAAVSDKVHEMLATAIHRSKSNGRSTVRPYDL